jgi:hypothetical protein
MARIQQSLATQGSGLLFDMLRLAVEVMRLSQSRGSGVAQGLERAGRWPFSSAAAYNGRFPRCGPRGVPHPVGTPPGAASHQTLSDSSSLAHPSLLSAIRN